MGVLADHQIEQLPITPMVVTSPPGQISSGLSSYGYDCRVGYKFKVFTNVWGAVVDPKNMDPRAFVDVDLTPGTESRHKVKIDINDHMAVCCVCGRREKERFFDNMRAGQCGPTHPDHILIPPNSFALAETIEEFEIPRDILAVCLGKSTYARCGIIVNITPLEPEWRGKITIEISNTTPLPAKIYAGEGIAQILFLRAEEECRTSYADKKGVYQNQSGLTLPKVRV